MNTERYQRTERTRLRRLPERAAYDRDTVHAITDPDEKEAALRALVEHIVPGRSDAVRGGDRRELAATAVLALPLAEVSAKVRTGGPVDDEPDYDLPIWAGVLPLRQVADPPVPDDRLDPSLDVPAHVATWHRPTRDGVTTRS